MIHGILKKIFGTKNEREIKLLIPEVEKINSLEDEIAALSDDELKSKTTEFRERLKNDESLDDILSEAFAVVRETSKRVLGMRHFDVQLMGGMILHKGIIAEMRTGEGKTLMSTLSVYLNALDGRGVHVVTVNDYLATRDAEWMGKIYSFLNLSVGIIVHGLDDDERKENYGADITYGTNNEFGFDYLRDNMKYDIEQYVQRELNYSIVDEVDSILIDEARTPLIISGPSEESTDKYYTINRIVPKLKKEEHFTIDEKSKQALLTEDGNARVESLLEAGNLYDPENMELVHHVMQGLRAHNLYRKDVDYVVNDGEVIIVDEFTGRLMPGRRWSDGLHQAIEAKEGVKIESENQTLATITFQNYFRMYNKLAGMTGTADTEAEEFAKIYNLDVMVIPTHRPMIRIDSSDMIYKNEKGKFNAIVNEIERVNANGQPVLVGTITIESSELLSKTLKRKGIKHSVLNAKHHDKEAEIIMQAGRSAAVTIATNMAGRGTDIVLGGNPEGLINSMLMDINEPTDKDRENALKKAGEICESEKKAVIEAGGLYILGTERHESRRIDNQLRGRSGRQGDPGASRFYLSLEDDLMRIFGSERISGLMDRLGMEDDMPIENKMVSKAVESAQKKVEGHNFDIRKHLLEYDDVMNKQRQEIYSYRRDILSGESHKERVLGMAEDVVDDLMYSFCPEDKYHDDWDMDGLGDAAFGTLGFHYGEIPESEDVRDFIVKETCHFYDEKEKEIGLDFMRYLEKVVMLQVVDTQWKDHLLGMDHLKEGIGLRGYGQRDPLIEYKKEAYVLFDDLTARISTESVTRLFRVQVKENKEIKREQKPQRLSYNTSDGVSSLVTKKRDTKKIGRNEQCPCGSGKKYKKCHGANA
jgi:preprotein translocase subunit SecA